jgi:hypothetical protein
VEHHEYKQVVLQHNQIMVTIHHQLWRKEVQAPLPTSTVKQTRTITLTGCFTVLTGYWGCHGVNQ